MPYTGHRRLPRPQNPAGSAWRLVNVHEGVEALVRVTTLVRSRTPTSDEAFHPPRSLGPLVIHTGTAAGSPQGWSRGDSNPGPPPCKGGALPAKLRPPGGVGAPGLEPGTSALSGPRSHHLSYAPAGRSPGRPSAGGHRVPPVTPLARCPRRSARREPAHSEFARCPAWRRRPPRPR
jgi:hypothetical protein